MLKTESVEQTVTFRFYGELNDFLSRERKHRGFSVCYPKRNSVKDMIESMGPPHTEVDLILVNGRSVDFTYIVAGSDRISVYPEFRKFDVSNLTPLRPVRLMPPRFVLDVHLGKLARYLRLLGFDTRYRNDWDEATLAAVAASGDERILLTRDCGLLKRSNVIHGYYIRAHDPGTQIREVVSRYRLQPRFKTFSRCIECNGTIRDVEKAQIYSRLPESVARSLDDFTQCEDCGRIYWKGSHYDRMRQLVENLVD